MEQKIFINTANTLLMKDDYRFDKYSIYSLKSFYVIPEPSPDSATKVTSMIVPCWYFGELEAVFDRFILERKNEINNSWEQVGLYYQHHMRFRGILCIVYYT